MKVLFLAILLTIQSHNLSLSSADEVQVISLGGKVEIANAGQTEYYSAKEGQVLYPFDKIKTQKNSSVEIGFDDKKENVVRIEEDTHAILLIREDEKIELLRGRIFTMLQNLPPGAAFEIRTPTAVTGARGTEWLTEVDKEGMTTVESYLGKPYIQNVDKMGKRGLGPVFVPAGKMSRVRKFMPPTALTKIPPARIKQWNQLKPIMQKRAIKAIKIPKVYPKPVPPVKSKSGNMSHFVPDTKPKPGKNVPVTKKTLQPVKPKYNIKKVTNVSGQ